MSNEEPPEYPIPPECCLDIMEVDENTGGCYCTSCGKRIAPIKDIEPDVPLVITKRRALCAAAGVSNKEKRLLKAERVGVIQAEKTLKARVDAARKWDNSPYTLQD